MDGINTQQTPSFIPKKPMVPKGELSLNVSGIFLFLSVLGLIVSVGGYFIARYQLTSKKEEVVNLDNILKKARDQFEPDQVVNMTRFDTKIKVANDLLYFTKSQGIPDSTAHVTLQPLFKLISDKTLKSVRFKDFKYSNVDNQKIEIKMSGEARSSGVSANYPAVAQQAREFADTRVLANVIVSDLNLGNNNNVTFNLSASVLPEFVSYTEQIKNAEQ